MEGLESAIKRAKAYVDAGADMIFPEGLANIDEFTKVYVYLIFKLIAS